MTKEKDNVLTVLGVITKESVRRQYENWCMFKSRHHMDLLEHDEIDERLLDVITDEELKMAIEVTNQAFSHHIGTLEDTYITSMLNLIIETKKYSMEENTDGKTKKDKTD